MDQLPRNDSSNSPDPAGDAADEALAEYLRRLEAGEPVDQEEFLEAYPEAAEALQSYFDGANLVDDLARRDRPPQDSFHSTATVAPRGSGKNLSVAGPFSSLPMQFGRFRVDRLLGRGAMGAVYLAWDTQLERPVALKVPKVANLDEEIVTRLLREARAAAILSHPHICRVYDVGTHDNLPFIAMEYIEGRPLSAFIDPENLLDERRCIGVVRKLALALAEAHAKGIIHRDLKPANILINHRGEPILTDFGLARLSQSTDGRATQSGTLIGSPAYMSPEQANADVARIGPRSDIYGLGVLLFELLTTELPFQGSVLTILSQIATKEPPAPSTLRPGLEARLDAICLKMMAKNPDDRFPSMKAVEQELGNWLKSEPVVLPPKKDAASVPTATAENISDMERRARKLLDEHDYEPAIPVLAKLAALKDAQHAAVAAWAKSELAAAKQKHQKLRERCKAACEKARALKENHDYAGAVYVLESIPEAARTDEVCQLLSEVTDLADECASLRQEIDDSLLHKRYSRLVPLIERYLKLKPDSAKFQRLLADLAKNRPQRAVANYRGTGRYIDVAGRLIEPREIVLAVIAILGIFFAVSYYVRFYRKMNRSTVRIELADDSTIAVTNGEAGARSANVMQHGSAITSMAVSSADGRFVVTGGADQAAKTWLWIPARKEYVILWRYARHTDVVQAVAISPNEHSILTGARDKTAIVWDNATGQLRHTLTGHNDQLWAVAFSPDSQEALTGSADGSAILWNADSGQRIRTFTLDQGLWVTAVAFSPDGRYVLTGSTKPKQGPTVILWDHSTGERVRTFDGHTGAVRSAAFSRDGRYLFTGSQDGTAILWDAKSAQQIHRLGLGIQENRAYSVPWAVAISPDGRRLATGFWPPDNTAVVWDAANGEPLQTFRGHSSGINAVAFHPDGKHLLSASADGTVRSWELSDPNSADRSRMNLNDWSEPVNLGPEINSDGMDGFPSLSADGRTLVFVSLRKGVGETDLWMCQRADPLASFDPPINLGPQVNSAAREEWPRLSADGLTLVFVSLRGDGQGYGDLWMSTRKTVTESFGPAINLADANSSANDSEPALSSDGLTLVFLSSRNGSVGAPGDLDLWMTTRNTVDETFRQAVNLGPTVNSAVWEGVPTLSADGLELVFATDRNHAEKNRDLWISKRKSRDIPFEPARDLGATVNSNAHETLPILSADGLTLTFESERREGQGGLDMWITRRGSRSDPFAAAENFGPFVNSNGFDGYPTLSGDGQSLLFHSERPDGRGGWDLWMSTRQDDRPAGMVRGAGWVDLFNGRDLTGWTPMLTRGNRHDNHQVTTGGWLIDPANGELVCLTTDSGWLRSDKKYSDFELEFEFLMPKGNNSGVIFRHPGQGALKPEIQLEDDPAEKAKGGIRMVGALFGLVAPSKDVYRPGVFNKMRITCVGDRLNVRLNDEDLVDTLLSSHPTLGTVPREGHIGFLNWVGKAKNCRFRNIRIRELDSTPMKSPPNASASNPVPPATPPRYLGIWVKNQPAQDWRCHIVAPRDQDDAEFQQTSAENDKDGFFPTSISGFVGDDGRYRFASVWTKRPANTQYEWQHSLTQEEFRQQGDGLRRRGFRPVWFDIFGKGTEWRYAMIWLKDGRNIPWDVTVLDNAADDKPAKEDHDKLFTEQRKTYQWRLGTIHVDSNRRHHEVWLWYQEPGGNWWSNYNFDFFRQKLDEHHKAGNVMPVYLESYARSYGDVRNVGYSWITRPSQGAEWLVTASTDLSAFNKDYDEQVAKGYRLQQLSVRSAAPK